MALTESQKAAISRAKRQQAVNGGNSFFLIVSVVLAFVVGGGYVWSVHQDSKREAQQTEEHQRQKLDEARATEDFLRQLIRWEDAKTVAANSPRIALGPAIAQMQAVRADLSLVTLHGCKAKAQPRYLSAMQATIDGYLAFMGQNGSDSAAARAIADAESMFTDATIMEGSCMP